MAGTPITVETSHGPMAGIDYGGNGIPVVLLHDILENSEAWRLVGPRISAFCRPVALDSFGHGQTRIPPPDPATAYRLIGEAIAGLGMHNPLLVGQGVGGWDLTATHILGHVQGRGLLLLEATFGGTREQTRAYVEQFANPEVIGYVVERFRLGARAADAQARSALVHQLVADAADDWVQAALHADVIRASAQRSFVEEPDGSWVRHPLPEELAPVLDLPDDLEPFPCAESYDQVHVPVWMMMASDGIYRDDPGAVDALLARGVGRELMVLSATRNISATHPDRVADAVRRMVELPA